MGIVNGTEWIVIIAIVAVVIFGAKKIPELTRSLGKASSEYEKAKVVAAKGLESIKDMGLTTPSDSEKIPVSHANSIGLSRLCLYYNGCLLF